MAEAVWSKAWCRPSAVRRKEPGACWVDGHDQGEPCPARTSLEKIRKSSLLRCAFLNTNCRGAAATWPAAEMPQGDLGGGSCGAGAAGNSCRLRAAVALPQASVTARMFTATLIRGKYLPRSCGEQDRRTVGPHPAMAQLGRLVCHLKYPCSHLQNAGRCRALAAPALGRAGQATLPAENWGPAGDLTPT